MWILWIMLWWQGPSLLASLSERSRTPNDPGSRWKLLPCIEIANVWHRPPVWRTPKAPLEHQRTSPCPVCLGGFASTARPQQQCLAAQPSTVAPQGQRGPASCWPSVVASYSQYAQAPSAQARQALRAPHPEAVLLPRGCLPAFSSLALRARHPCELLAASPKGARKEVVC